MQLPQVTLAAESIRSLRASPRPFPDPFCGLRLDSKRQAALCLVPTLQSCRRASPRPMLQMQAATPHRLVPTGPATTPNVSGSLGAVGSSLRLGPLRPAANMMSLDQWVASQTGSPLSRCGIHKLVMLSARLCRPFPGRGAAANVSRVVQPCSMGPCVSLPAATRGLVALFNSTGRFCGLHTSTCSVSMLA